MSPPSKPPRKLIHEFVDLAHKDKNLEELKKLLEAYPPLLNSPRPGKDKETAMGAAIHSHAKKIIRFLLREGVEEDVFTACVLGQTNKLKAYLDDDPRLVTAKAKYAHNVDLVDVAPAKKIVDMLLKRGYPLTIHVAAGKGMIDKIDEFLEADPALIESRGNEDHTPLFDAIWSGQDEAALHLLKLGCQHDVDGAAGRPMSYACIWGRDVVAEALLDRGIDVHYQFLGFSYLHAVVNWEMGTTEANLRIIKMLFEAGVDPTLRDKDGRTALEIAKENKLDECAKLILELASN